MDLVVFPVDWACGDRKAGPNGEDSDDGDDGGLTTFEITCYGKLLSRESVCLRIPFYPYFFVECPRAWSHSRAAIFVAECVATLNAHPKFSLPVTRKTIWGFTNNEPRLFVQLAFSTLAAFRRARSVVVYQRKMATYESSVDQVVRLFHVRNLQPASWIRVASPRHVPSQDRIATTDVEVMADFTALAAASTTTPSTATDIPPLVLASWDIECYSSTGAFPLADRPDDVICAICTTFQRFGEPAPFLRHAVVLGSCAPVDGVEVVACDSEPQLINAWLAALKTHDADVLVAWNSYGFDYKYVYGRSLVCVDDDFGSPLVALHTFGKAIRGGGEPAQKSLSSAAYGDNSFFWIAGPGFLHLDLMFVVKKEHKLDSYSLNHVAAKFLGDAKVDLSPAELFAKVRGSADDRADIVRYCAKDTELPLRIMAKLSIFNNLLEMANAASVTLDALLTRGQQIKVFSLILKKARTLGFICPDASSGAGPGQGDEEGFVGATVLEAQTGAYLDEIICALDFASLYPSIIRAHNLCPSTLVLDQRYNAIDGIDYYEVETPGGTFRFAQGVEAVLPALLNDLAAFRKAAKKAMAAAKADDDAFQVAVQNGRQLAFKVSMNSAYGFFGATRGFLPCLPLAMSVTTTGRNMIATTKRLVEELVPGSRVIYGDTDSVLVSLKIVDPALQDSMAAHFEVAQRVADDISKQFLPPNELEFEKAYSPYLLFSKKRYAGMMFTSPDKPDSMDCKGIQLVRRDNCPLVKVVSQSILDAIMTQKTAEAAFAVAKQHVVSVLRNEAPLESYIVSKALRSEYKNPDSQPHLQVAKKVHQRRGYPVPSGERVPYVFVEDCHNPDGLQASRAEDPAHVAENALVVDRLHYLDSQLAGPIETLLNVLQPGAWLALLKDADIAPLVEELRSKRAGDVKVAKRLRANAAKNQREISHYFFRPSLDG